MSQDPNCSRRSMLREFWRNEWAKNAEDDCDRMMLMLLEWEEQRLQVAQSSSGKTHRTSKSGRHTSSSNINTSCDADGYEVCTHPIEQKTGKRKAKSKVTQAEELQEDFDSKWEKIEKYQREELAIREAELKHRDIELFHKDYEILMKDTSGMTPEQLHIHLKIVEKIRERRGI